MLRQAVQSDRLALEQYLAQHPETSMFLRGNLAAHGLDNSDHRHGTTYWLHDSGGISGVIGCSNGGYLMCQAPAGDAVFWQAAAEVLEAREVAGITGVPAQVNAWIAALGLQPDAFSIKVTEPLYIMALSDLVVPDMAGLTLRRPQAEDANILARWFDGYASDTGITPTDGPTGARAAEVFIAHDAARLLECEGRPVAMTSLNAQVAGTVQVGGVYVPTDLRGRGLGGRVVAAQLQELRSIGNDLAILFAANEAAARAYARIGFRHIGSYEVAMLKAPHRVERYA